MGSLLDSLASVIDHYFTQPLKQPGSVAPYNWVNTLVFALVALAAAWLILKTLQKWRVPIDEHFFRAVVPFVVFGATVRVVVDAQILQREVVVGGVTLYPFVTPGIYLLTFLLLVLAMELAWWRAGRDPARPEFTHTLRAMGLVLAALALLPLVPLLKNFPQAALILGLAALGGLAFEGVDRLRGRGGRPLRRLERALVLGQAFDGAATFVGVGLGVPGQNYAEQHVVGNLVFGAFGGPWAFYALKVLFALVVVWVLQRELSKPEERETRVYLLLLITILGLGPGTRDFLRITAGV